MWSAWRIRILDFTDTLLLIHLNGRDRLYNPYAYTTACKLTNPTIKGTQLRSTGLKRRWSGGCRYVAIYLYCSWGVGVSNSGQASCSRGHGLPTPFDLQPILPLHFLRHIICAEDLRFYKKKNQNYTPWLKSASELYRQSDRRLSAKLVPTFADRGGVAWSAWLIPTTVLCFLDRIRYFFFQVAPQLYLRGWVDPVPDPLLLRKTGSIGNRTRTSGSAARNSDHSTRGSEVFINTDKFNKLNWKLS
jgi:hypothetical protein